MTYDSPTQIRNRQRRAEEKALRPRRQRPTTNNAFRDAAWVEACDFHIAQIREHIERGAADSAGRHAEALAHMAITRRAFELMRIGRPDMRAAMRMAKAELYDGEAA